MTFDAVVVGAGPGGCSAASSLGRAGYAVLLIEKSNFPRYKPCGGSISEKALKSLKNP